MFRLIKILSSNFYYSACSEFYRYLISLCLCIGIFFSSITEAEVEYLVPSIISVRPHDPAAFTQGLAIRDGSLYESTGLYGQSSLKQFNLQTNELIRHFSLPVKYFAEGIALVGNQLIQTTWKEKTAFVYDLTTFNLIHSFHYKGEGWGLCCDGKRIFMSNGSDAITLRDLNSFAVLGKYRVHLGNQTFSNLNDLECVGDDLYANIWKKEIILRLDKLTGTVTGIIDASGLLTSNEKELAGPEGVLNGIAYHAENQTFFITGKQWPWLFEVKFVPQYSRK